MKASLFAVLLALAVSSNSSVAAGSWTIKTVAGTGVAGGAGDGGAATSATIDNPFGVTRGPDGALYFCEYTGQRIRRIHPNGRIDTVAGSGLRGFGGDGGPALKASFNLPHELRFDSMGRLFVVDMANHAVRRIDLKTGIISTIAGNGKPGYSGDGGPASQAQFKQPHSIAFGADDTLYVCDIGNHVIRAIDPVSGMIRTVAGTGKAGPTPNGAPVHGTPINGPRSLDVDAQGNLWLCTREGNQVFKLDLRANRIEHVAGTGAKGTDGNGGPALRCTLSGPKGIDLDAQGNVWLADCESHSIRMIRRSDWTIHLIAGTGKRGNGGEGNPLACAMARPHGVYCDADGGIYIGDSESHKVRVLRPVTTVQR